jgi:hypothetical protein
MKQQQQQQRKLEGKCGELLKGIAVIHACCWVWGLFVFLIFFFSLYLYWEYIVTCIKVLAIY